MRRGVGERRWYRCWPTTARVTAAPDLRVLDELEELGAEGGTDILFVGRVVPSKAQHDLVKALWAYRRLYDTDARLHLLGGTSSYEYNKSLQDFVDDLGLARAVRIAGEVSDASLAAYFAVAEVFLSLSVHEGFGVPLVEAMSAGMPVVVRWTPARSARRRAMPHWSSSRPTRRTWRPLCTGSTPMTCCDTG